MSDVYLIKSEDRYCIVSGFGDDLGGLQEKAYTLDELIAEPVMKLCNKGYITNYSCSGHSYSDMSYTIIEDVADQESAKKTDCFTIVPFLDTRAICVCKNDNKLEDETYIAFEEDHNFEGIPDGWFYEHKALRYKWNITDSPTEFYIKLLSQIKKLIEWIDSLPNKNT